MSQQSANKDSILKMLSIIKDYKDNKKNLFKNSNYDIMVTFEKGAIDIDEAIKSYQNISDDTELEVGDFSLLVGHKKALENGEPIESAFLVTDDPESDRFYFDASFAGPFATQSTESYSTENFETLLQKGLKLLKKEADVVAKKYLRKRPKP